MPHPPVLTAGAAWGTLPVIRDGGWLGVVMATVPTTAAPAVDLAFLTEAGDFLTAETGDLLLTA